MRLNSNIKIDNEFVATAALLATVLISLFGISSCVQNQQSACIEGILDHATESQVWENQVAESIADCAP